MRQSAGAMNGVSPPITSTGSVSGWLARVWSAPASAGVMSLAVYTALAAAFSPNGLSQSTFPYFVYLADALLQGQLALAQLPPTGHDLVLYQGNYYLYWPPFPAVLFLPLVAVFGVAVSDVPLTLGVAALNVALVALLLEMLHHRGIAELPPEKRAWLTAFFALGTVHLTLAPYARVWYTAQIIGFALCCAAYVAALRLRHHRAPLAAGAFLGLSFLTRMSLPLAGLWVWWFMLRDQLERRSAVTPEMQRRIGLSFLPLVAGLVSLAVGIAAFGLYNHLRFGNALDMGIAYHQMDEAFRADYERYGAFNIHYLPTNSFYTFVAIPYLGFPAGGDEHFWMGGSLFLLSPVFLLALPGLVRSWRSHGWALAASIAGGLAPALLVMGTGWVQFGPRYTLDITVPLLVATAIGAASVPTRLVAVLSVVAFAMYLPGAILLGARL